MINNINFKILKNKLIDKVKLLFCHLTNKAIILNFIAKFKLIENYYQNHKAKILSYILSKKSSNNIKFDIKTILTKIKSSKIVKNIIDFINDYKVIDTTPDGILGINISNNSIFLVYMVFTNLSDVVIKSIIRFNLNNIDLNFQAPEQKLAMLSIINKYIQASKLLNITGAYVLAPSQYVISLVELPTSKENNTTKEKAIFWSIKDYINYSIDDAILASFLVPVNKTQGNVQLAYAVAMRAKLSEEIGKTMDSAGVGLKYIDIPELSIRNIVSLYSELQQGCLVLAIFDDNVSILLIKDNALFISRNTKLDLKPLDGFDPGKNNNDESYLQKINLLNNLSSEVQRSLDYTNSIFRNLQFNNVAILPCKLNLTIVIDWLSKQLSMPIIKIDLKQKIKFETNVSDQDEIEYILAIGAALRNINYVTAN